MSINGIGAPGFNGYANPSMMRQMDQTADTSSANSSTSAAGSSTASGGASGAPAGAASPAASPPANPLSGGNMFQLASGAQFELTGEVSAALPNGITVSFGHFAPRGSSGSSASSSNGADYAYMAAAVEQMVDDFMKSGSAGQTSSSTSSATAVAPPGATDGATATLPDGVALGVWGFDSTGSDQDQASSSGSAYAAMTAALEQMVDHFMNATSAYQQGASNSSTQGGSTATVA